MLGSVRDSKAGIAARGVVGVAAAPVRLAGVQVRTVTHLAGRTRQDGVLALPAFPGRMLPGKTAVPFTKVAKIGRGRAGKDAVQPLVPVIKTPQSPFNGQLAAERSYAFADLPLADFKAVGTAFGVTLNDAVVAVCAGALRRYMLSTDQVPSEPLIVCVPASIRTGAETVRWTNQISRFFAEFPTHLDGPLERLNAVHTDLKSAKDTFDALPTHLFRDVMKFVPQTMWDVSVKPISKKPDWMPGATWNVVVSNRRGPSHTVELCGATLAGLLAGGLPDPGHRPEHHGAELPRQGRLRLHGLHRPAARPVAAAGPDGRGAGQPAGPGRRASGVGGRRLEVALSPRARQRTAQPARGSRH